MKTGEIPMDMKALCDDLTEAFINYQWRFDRPMPSPGESQDEKIRRYQTDPVFNAKVKSIVAGVCCIIDKHEIRSEEYESTAD